MRSRAATLKRALRDALRPCPHGAGIRFDCAACLRGLVAEVDPVVSTKGANGGEDVAGQPPSAAVTGAGPAACRGSAPLV